MSTLPPGKGEHPGGLIFVVIFVAIIIALVIWSHWG